MTAEVEVDFDDIVGDPSEYKMYVLFNANVNEIKHFVNHTIV